jgi:hypothetical protein
MTQQPLLTADEVIELLKEALPNKEEWHDTFNELVEKTKLASGFFDDSDTTISLLKYCVDYLRNKGIYVYFEYDCIPFRSRLSNFKLIAGECGRVYEEMLKFKDYLFDLIDFIYDNKEKLPPEVVAEEKRVEEYLYQINDEVIEPLECAYADSDKAEINSVLEKAQTLTKEIEEDIKDLCRLHALATIL